MMNRTADDIKRDMSESLPRVYADSRVVANFIERHSDEFAALNVAIRDVLNQFFIDTATWGLAKWEEICGIPTDESKPYDQRRSVIKSKIRGIGTVTIAMIKNVAEAYLNGEVDVTNNYANYEVIVTFIGKRGVPPNLNDIQTALRDIIPAHLALTINFTYVTYDQLKDKYASYDALVATNKTYDEILVT